MKKTRNVYLEPLNIQWDAPTGYSFTPPRCNLCGCITSIVYLDRNGFCEDCLNDTDHFDEIQSEHTDRCNDLQATIDEFKEIITENNTSVSTSQSKIKKLKDLAKSYKRLDDLDDTIEKYSLMENKLNSIFELLGVI